MRSELANRQSTLSKRTPIFTCTRCRPHIIPLTPLSSIDPLDRLGPDNGTPRKAGEAVPEAFHRVYKHPLPYSLFLLAFLFFVSSALPPLSPTPVLAVPSLGHGEHGVDVHVRLLSVAWAGASIAVVPTVGGGYERLVQDHEQASRVVLHSPLDAGVDRFHQI